MEQVFNESGYPLDIKELELLSNLGNEFIVYKYFDSVVKIYKEDYTLTHLSLDELKALKKIPTERILMPTGILYDKGHELIGYEMPYIKGQKNLEQESVFNFFHELEILKQDLDILCSNFIILRDINLSNTIFNGKLYLIDPGNYLINEMHKIIYHLDVDSLSLEEKEKLLIEWNYNKINRLIDMLLFSNKSNIDPFQFRQIVQFIMKEREENNLIYNLDILKMYFNQDLSIGDAINDFIKNHIKDNPEERALFLSLFNKG